jgi:hypothetical protein
MTTGGQPGGDGGQGGQQGGQGGQQGGGQQPAVPWSAASDGQIWTIGDKPWYETALPEGPARTLAQTKRYANPAVMATSYAELERINASRDDSKMVRIPDENAKPEDWNQVYEKLGRPKDPSGYDKVNWGKDADPALVEFGKGLAFKLGLSPKAAEAVMATEWNKFVETSNAKFAEQQKTEGAQALAAIKAEWKGDFEANQARGRQVLQALNKAGFSEADLASVERNIGIPAVVKLLATIGKLSGEGQLLTSGGQGGGSDPSQMTPEQAKSEIQRRTADKDFQKTYMTKTEPGHAEAVKLMEGLYKKAGPLMGGAAS